MLFFRKWIDIEMNDQSRWDENSKYYLAMTVLGDHKVFTGHISGLGLTLNITMFNGESIQSCSFPYHLESVGQREKGGKETAAIIIKHVEKTLKGLGKDWFNFKLFKLSEEFKYIHLLTLSIDSYLNFFK